MICLLLNKAIYRKTKKELVEYDWNARLNLLLSWHNLHNLFVIFLLRAIIFGNGVLKSSKTLKTRQLMLLLARRFGKQDIPVICRILHGKLLHTIFYHSVLTKDILRYAGL